MTLHPASLILIYFMAALVIPGLPFFMLPILLWVAMSALILLRRAPLRLVWRTRWLLLVLLLGYAYSIPGEPVWQVLGRWAPSWEGAAHGTEQAIRLIVLLLWLDVLVLRLPAEDLLSGLYTLFQPLSFKPLSLLKLDPSRLALRLGLTLRAIEDLERGRGNLKRLLQPDHGFALPERMQLRLTPLRWIDLFIPVGLFLGCLLCL